MPPVMEMVFDTWAEYGGDSSTQTLALPVTPIAPLPNRLWGGTAVFVQLIVLIWAFGSLWTQFMVGPSVLVIMLLGLMGWVSCTVVLASTIFGLQAWHPGWRSQLLLLDNASTPSVLQVWQSILGLVFTIEIVCVAAAWYSTQYS
ncbi:hypothetical protein LTS15_002614 [Exophiala xenobiotica]|nr:hypothetical protein LTS15_002614 [Exophiala xenobiotica]